MSDLSGIYYSEKKMRKINLRDLEREIQERSRDKNDYFLAGDMNYDWKKYLFEYDNFDIYEVEGEYVRNNLCCYFGWGGHGRVHEFIPHFEIWISKDHAPIDEMARTILHEINEYKKMKNLPYFQAHQNSLAEEHRNPKKLRKIIQCLKKKI